MRLLIVIAMFLGLASIWFIGEKPKPTRVISSLQSESVSPVVERCVAKMKAEGIDISPLKVPTQYPNNTAYQTDFYSFLRSYEYRKMKWPGDKRVRDTGDFEKGAFNGQDYNGTHPAVVIYYSPEVYCWLLADRAGIIPDGAMIIKEMYPAPAGRYEGQKVEDLDTPWWTVMVKDSAGSYDGWYWGAVFDKLEGGQRIEQLTDEEHPDVYPESNFGSYCVRCHSSTAKEQTFSSLDNIEFGKNYITGEEREEFGHPIEFKDDEAWKDASYKANKHHGYAHMMPMIWREQARSIAADQKSEAPLNQSFADFYGRPFSNLKYSQIQKFPKESFDRVPQPPTPQQYVTSDQCMGCHAGDNTPYGPNMFLKGLGPNGKGQDVSPWGEWRWSMMGLAGRDPVFFAQLESELEKFKNANGEFNPEKIANTCLSCHGGMGQRQHHIDHGGKEFSAEELYKRHSKYGALGRDGISCMMCHQMQDNSAANIEDIYTGNFKVEPLQNGKNIVKGPYKDVIEKPMEQALGMIPKHDSFIQSSRLCASCHSIHLPALDKNGNTLKAGFEQATYLEWVNSDYYRKGESCQECHMPDHFKGRKLDTFKAANIQDADFPTGYAHGEQIQAHNMLPLKPDLLVKKREKYRRHTLNGINLFTLEFFGQFDDVLGRRKQNYMTYLTDGFDAAIEEGVEMATKRTAKVQVVQLKRKGTKIEAEIVVENKAGHRFPSGVGFRRAFLEVKLTDASGKVVWQSGATNAMGAIVDGQGKVLPVEFLEGRDYQKHHQVITRQDQAQIYQELVRDQEGKFTTSFLTIYEHTKDNRLLPKGWQNSPVEEGKRLEGINYEQFKATRPVGLAAKDKDFTDGKGRDRIRYVMDIGSKANAKGLKISAKLYYQALPPYYLKQRFESAKGQATERLYYLASRLKTEGRPIDGWKLFVSGDEKSLR